MKKPVLIAIAVLLALFGGITLLKSRPVSVDDPDGGEARTATEKEAVHRFWQTYRQATDHRVAGRWAEAAEAYRQALALDDGHEDALYYLGNTYLELGHLAAAEKAWTRLVHRNPNSARAHAQLGHLYFCFEQEGFFNLEAADAAFRRAMTINKEETGPVLRLGQIALIRGDHPEAQSHFDRVIGSNYQSVEAYFLNGYLAWKAGRTQRASELFTQALHYAQPVREVSGEGDTKAGAAPMLSRLSGCQAFQTHIRPLTGLEDAADELGPRYQELDALLVRFRSRMRRGTGDAVE